MCRLLDSLRRQKLGCRKRSRLREATCWQQVRRGNKGRGAQRNALAGGVVGSMERLEVVEDSMVSLSASKKNLGV